MLRSLNNSLATLAILICIDGMMLGFNTELFKDSAIGMMAVWCIIYVIGLFRGIKNDKDTLDIEP